MSDIKVDQTTGDIVIGADGDLVLTTGVDAIEQHLRQRIQTFLGEWFLDSRIGLAYFEHILRKDFNPTVIDSIFKTTILETPGVEDLQAFDIDLEPSTREMTLTFTVKTQEGDIDFSQVLGVI